MIEVEDLIGLLCCYMRRRRIGEIVVSYHELSSAPSLLELSKSDEGDLRVRLGSLPERVLQEMKDEACRTGRPVTREVSCGKEGDPPFTPAGFRD